MSSSNILWWRYWAATSALASTQTSEMTQIFTRGSRMSAWDLFAKYQSRADIKTLAVPRQHFPNIWIQHLCAQREEPCRAFRLVHVELCKANCFLSFMEKQLWGKLLLSDWCLYNVLVEGFWMLRPECDWLSSHTWKQMWTDRRRHWSFQMILTTATVFDKVLNGCHVQPS